MEPMKQPGAWEALSQPYDLALALTCGAEAALGGQAGPPGRADREAAAERLRRAEPLADRLGARPLAESIMSLARRAGLQLGPRTQAREDQLGLTAREHEVLRLLAAGRSNRDIGQPNCSSAPRQSACTCPTSWPSWAGPAGEPRRWRSPAGAG